MPEYTAPWFYGNSSIGLLEAAETALRKYWIIPLDVPWNMFTLASGNADVFRFQEDRKKFAVICPSVWSWYSVYDKETGVGIYVGDSLHRTLEIWASNTETRAVYGHLRTNQGVSCQLVIPCKGLTTQDIAEYIENAENQYKH